jgi:phenylacetate-CoA ligase
VVAVQLWFDEWSGCAPGEPKVVLSGRRPFLRERARGWIGSILRNELRLYASRLSARDLAAHVDRINELRPVQVVGAAWLLHEIARHAEAGSGRIVSPRAVMTSFEALMPETAQVLRRAFGAPVFNRYGSSELGPVACSCGVEPRLHVSMLTHRVEVLRGDGEPCEPGETGELVVTHLVNRTMPLIRYRIGDLATPGPRDPCRCGRTLASIAEVSGRVMDAFVRSDGSLVSGSYIGRFYRSVSGIRQFQVVQLAPTRVHVRLVERRETANGVVPRHANLRVIERHLQRALGDGCRVTFELVDEISRERSGKYRPTVCLIPESDRPPGRHGPTADLRPAGVPAGEPRER